MILLYGFLVFLVGVALYAVWLVYRVFFQRLEVGDGLNNTDVTIVTGIFDIGNYSQGIEKKFSDRNFQKYLAWFHDVAQIDVNMVIFVPSRARAQVEAARAGYPGKTQVYEYDEQRFTERPFFARIQQFIDRAHDVRRPMRIEMQNPMYNAVMFSKIDFVNTAISDNPFASRYFLWLDGGYAHGLSGSCVRDVMGQKWPDQRKLDALDGRILVNQVTPFRASDSADPERYFLAHRPRFAGNCWGGAAETLRTYHQLYVAKVAETLDAGYMDDDQAIIYAVYWDHPELFHVVSGSKFGLFRDYLYAMKYLGAG